MDEQTAAELARAWGGDAHIGLQAVPGGWVTWTGGDPDDPPAAGVGRRAAIDARTELLTRWPSWDVEEIATRLAAATPDDRFPPHVRAHLEAAGWYEGRRLSDDHLDQIAASFAALAAERPVRLHDTARAFLAEFGGLTVAPHGRPAVSFAPVTETFDTWLLDVPEDVLGQHFCPVAVYRDGWPSEVELGERGRSLLRAGPEFYEVAHTPHRTAVDLLTRSAPRLRLYIPDEDD